MAIGLSSVIPVLLLAGCQQAPPPDTLDIGGVSFVASRLQLRGPDVAAADLNGDGHTDIVGAGEPLRILFGDGDGTFSATATAAGGKNPTYLATADIDGDGDRDILVANHETDHVSILLGDGAGNFDPAPQSPFTVGVDPHPHAVETADLDGDDSLDLVVDDRNRSGLAVFRGSGDGRFEETSTLVDVGGDPYIGMAIGDLNDDGILDVVTPNPRRVAVVFGLGGPGIRFSPPGFLEADSPFGVEIVDLTGDGHADILSVSGENSAGIQLFGGDGDGGFKLVQTWEPAGMRGPKMTAGGDFNGDGIDDAAVACYQSTDVVVILGGRDAFQTHRLPAGEHPWGLAAADLNGDGVDDLVIGDDARAVAFVYVSMRE